MDKVRETAIKNSLNWWYCDNVVNEERKEEIGLLHMGFPRVFILIRDQQDAYFSSFDEFREHIAEVNFFAPADREEADIDSILIDAWNFMALQEEEDERIAEQGDYDEFL